MTFFVYHLLAAAVVAGVFGVLIDVDHSGVNRETIKCAASVRIEDCLNVGGRGIFHNLRLWGLMVCGVWAWTIHLIMDKIIYLIKWV